MYCLIPEQPSTMQSINNRQCVRRVTTAQKCVCNCIEDWSGCWLGYIPELHLMAKQYSLCTIAVITFSKFMTLIGHRSVSITIFGTKVLSILSVLSCWVVLFAMQKKQQHNVCCIKLVSCRDYIYCILLP